MKKFYLGAAAAALVTLSAMPAFAEGQFLCQGNLQLFVCEALGDPNGVPLPVAALGLPIAGGLFLMARRKSQR
ncbi:hypothetical protein HDIA_1296 [Hartmannibacter diazotrophicus]|uniref:VPEID-CTERM protein sorting domain protein n=2 Tax=Hartmannibacter diazotrophicus TaxID=1482074 RepID=A0A2C9D3D2_9HYPH|nr:hypothetical protein HDIA_1296 [Hartmannibacter diazotrophicus]